MSVSRHACAFAQIAFQERQIKRGNFKPSVIRPFMCPRRLNYSKKHDRGKKCIVANLIKEHLTARGLAYWYINDGGVADKGR
jgi:hypothetical protein